MRIFSARARAFILANLHACQRVEFDFYDRHQCGPLRFRVWIACKARYYYFCSMPRDSRCAECERPTEQCHFAYRLATKTHN